MFTIRRTVPTLAGVGVLAAACGGWAIESAQAPSADPQLAELAFLTGGWTAEFHGDQLEEHWTAPSHGTIAGVFRWMSDGVTTMSEHILIEETDDGVRMLLRHFNEGLEPWESEADTPTSFTLESVDDQRAVFSHDRDAFPHRITYHRSAPDTLVARLEDDGDSGREMEFIYRSQDMTTSTETLNDTGVAMGYDGGLTLAFQVSDLDRAVAWYQDALGFKILYKMDEMAWCELSTGVDKVNIGLSQVESVTPGGPTPTFGVRDIDHARSLLESKGVTFDGPTQEIPEMVKLATFYDPDGNSLMLFQALGQMP